MRRSTLFQALHQLVMDGKLLERRCPSSPNGTWEWVDSHVGWTDDGSVCRAHARESKGEDPNEAKCP
jgi:hypothetical protein